MKVEVISNSYRDPPPPPPFPYKHTQGEGNSEAGGLEGGE